MELTQNNYLRGSGSGSTWHVDIDPPKRKVSSYFEETIKAVKYVDEQKVGKTYLLYSGGMDSQYVFNVYHRLKIPFTPVIVRLVGRYSNHDYNIHETKYAFEHCNKVGIKPIVMEMNFDSFIENGECFELAKTFDCGSWWLPHTMKAASQIDGFVIMGNDPPYMRYVVDGNYWALEELQYIHSIMKYFTRHNVNGCPFLLSYTPEMMLAFLLDPSIKKLADGKMPGKLGTNSTKCDVFNRGSNFNMENYNFQNGRKKAGGLEFVITTPLIESEVWKEQFEWQKQFRGEYLENYYEAVKRLSIHQ